MESQAGQVKQIAVQLLAQNACQSSYLSSDK